MTTLHSDKRSATAPELNWSVEREALTAHDGEAVVKRVQAAEVTHVRLSLEVAGKDVQVVCRVTTRDGEAVFGSQSWAGVGQWNNRAASFRSLLGEWHRVLLPRRDEIAFLEGQSLGFRWVMTLFGLVTGLAGTAVALWFLVVQENPAGLFAVAPAVTGGWIAWLFRPKPPKPYDPETYAAKNEAG
ncbi:MAG: hypothetical protein CMF74_07135 [Maricaulis sp.]|jgi:hypothetical protein|nr:hypothetical protein [Maricaulis sp.]HAQ34336.1 hypothetical protein [Alphaproteobacteria bacterium]